MIYAVEHHPLCLQESKIQSCRAALMHQATFWECINLYTLMHHDNKIHSTLTRYAVLKELRLKVEQEQILEQDGS